MTLFFKKEHFKTAIPLAITSMLVMYTLKGSVTSKLPATSYIKFVDIWLLYGLLVPFFILLLLVLIEHLPEKPKVLNTRSHRQVKRELNKMIEYLPSVSQKGNISSFDFENNLLFSKFLVGEIMCKQAGAERCQAQLS